MKVRGAYQGIPAEQSKADPRHRLFARANGVAALKNVSKVPISLQRLLCDVGSRTTSAQGGSSNEAGHSVP